MITDVIFICGLGGDAGMTYVSSLKNYCENRGWKFYAPSMPDFVDGITYDKYKASFERLLNTENLDLKNVLIIGQSAGTNFIVKYCAHNNLEIGAYVSVSGPSANADREISEDLKDRLVVLEEFFPSKEEYLKFKQMKFKKISIYGGKDCLFTKKNLEYYANLIGAKKYYDENGVHCVISEKVSEHKLLHEVLSSNF